MPNINDLTARELSGKIGKLSERLERRINQAVDRLDGDAKAMEKELLRLILEKFVGRLKVGADGKIIVSPRNLVLVSELENLFLAYRSEFVAGSLRPLSGEYLDIIEMTGAYYTEMEFPENVVARVAESNAAIEARLGLDGKRIVKDGYLYRLGQTLEVRDRLKNFVLNAITTGANLKDFTEGLKVKVVGNKDVDGELVRYFRQYAYDTFNQVHEVKNKEFAAALGLQWFIYTGSIIKTTRKFCRKKAGKVFSTEEAESDWPTDPDLIGKKRPEPYSPLIDRGRWNCRHFIKYISAPMAVKLGRPEAGKNN